MEKISENNSTYIKNKNFELIERFGDEKINIYIDFYTDMPFVLQQFFSLIHFEINRLFKYMNSRIKSGQYTAHESRDLLFLIDIIKIVQANTKGSEFAFNLIPKYKERLDECETFLQSSNGSIMPRNFEKIIPVENEPIFLLASSISIARANKKVAFQSKTIGNGSYASVHKYKDEFYNRYFAIKKAYNDLSSKELERFRTEFEEMKKLKSPYVIEVYHYDEEKHEYIMEYADETLDSYISKNNNTLKMGERIGLVKQILQAFIYINNKGILHRDISTKNILIKRYDGLNVIKVSDFGLVKLQESTLTSKNTEFKGSLNDPKLEIMGFSNYETRHETYALTRLIYFVLTGKMRINSFNSNTLKDFVMKGISDKIEDRYQTIEEQRDAFTKIINTLK